MSRRFFAAVPSSLLRRPAVAPNPMRPMNLDRVKATSIPGLSRHAISRPAVPNLSLSSSHSTCLAVPPSIPASPKDLQKSSKAEAEQLADIMKEVMTSYGEDSAPRDLSATWGKRWWGNLHNRPRGLVNLSKYRSKKFAMKKHRYTKRWRFRRLKVAAVGNTPFAKKVRVMMSAKFSQQNDKDIDAISREQLSDAMESTTASAKPGGKSGRGKPKSKYM
eukprot:PhM_4_TR2945/c0_g1_i1/m.61935